MRSLLALAVVSLLGTTAAAQSKRYPPEPVDKDQETADRSALWESATSPALQPYEKLLSEARVALAERTDDQHAIAVAKLGQAIALAPDLSAAYQLRADAFMAQRQYGKCADDLLVIQRRATTEDIDRRVQQDQRRQLGICLGRADRFAEAERVLAEAAVAGATTGEMLMRLGEVRIAMGKLDEGIAALSSAIDSPDMQGSGLARWLLSAAYDRARRSREARDTARSAIAYDRDLSQLRNPTMPLLGDGELEYLLGLAYEYGHAEGAPAQPERALVMFRRFVTKAPDSPWRRRAEEHVRDLEGTALPEAVQYRAGGAKLDVVLARAVVRKQMPALRACMAKTPNVVFLVSVTKTGPKSEVPKSAPVVIRPPHLYGRPYVPRPIRPPAEGVQIEAWNESDAVPRAAKDAALRCLDPVIARLPFAPIKEAGAYAVFSFALVSL